jgi:hypothetical protein
MSETAQLIISLLLFGAAIVLTRQFHAWKIKKAYLRIIDDLKSQGALAPESAINLPYAQRPLLRMGLKDHRPTALKSLVTDAIVGMTDDGRYYLLDKRV